MTKAPISYAELAGQLLTHCSHYREHTVRQAVGHLLSVAKDRRPSLAESLGWSEAALAEAELGDIIRVLNEFFGAERVQALLAAPKPNQKRPRRERTSRTGATP